jgi:hypothetical protein
LRISGPAESRGGPSYSCQMRSKLCPIRERERERVCVCVCDGENDKKEESILNDRIERWRRIVVVFERQVEDV